MEIESQYGNYDYKINFDNDEVFNKQYREFDDNDYFEELDKEAEDVDKLLRE